MSVCVCLPFLLEVGSESCNEIHIEEREDGFRVVCIIYIFLSLECMYECNNITQQYIDVAEIRLLA